MTRDENADAVGELGFEAKLWAAADKLRSNMDASEYKHVVLGLRRAFWVPKEARWDYLASNAKKPEIGKLVDEAMDVIEKDNHSLQGILLKNYARPGLNKHRLGELI